MGKSRICAQATKLAGCNVAGRQEAEVVRAMPEPKIAAPSTALATVPALEQWVMRFAGVSSVQVSTMPHAAGHLVVRTPGYKWCAHAQREHRKNTIYFVGALLVSRPWWHCKRQ